MSWQVVKILNAHATGQANYSSIELSDSAIDGAKKCESSLSKCAMRNDASCYGGDGKVMGERMAKFNLRRGWGEEEDRGKNNVGWKNEWGGRIDWVQLMGIKLERCYFVVSEETQGKLGEERLGLGGNRNRQTSQLPSISKCSELVTR